jgi:hypothetical protein
MLKKKYYTGLQIHEAIDGVVGDYKKAIEIYRRLAKMETDDVQPVRHGKWLLHEYPDGYYHTECSECGKVYSEDVYYLKNQNYCPNCGARNDIMCRLLCEMGYEEAVAIFDDTPKWYA